MRTYAPYLALLLATLVAAPAFGQRLAPQCGQLGNAYGPFDYTNPVHFRDSLPVVERAHFDGGVESLRGNQKYKHHSVHGDLDYTLRAFPNHHRALHSMGRYYLTKEKFNRTSMRYSADCYFQRAMAFKPSDGVVRMVYGVYLYKAGDINGAKLRFDEALKRAPNDPEVHYNLGLVLAKSKEWDKARTHAKRAYELGHPMPGLRKKLKRAGHWD